MTLREGKICHLGSSRKFATVMGQLQIEDNDNIRRDLLDMWILLGTALQIRRQHSPRPSLRQPRLKMLRHRERAGELPEDHLLPRFGRDALCEQLCGGARVEVREEAVYARFAKFGEPMDISGQICRERER